MIVLGLDTCLSSCSVAVLDGKRVVASLGRVIFAHFPAQNPAELRGWFARHAGRTGALMFPLGAAGFAAALATCLVTRTTSAVLAAIASAGVVGVTVLVNEPANRRFAGPVYLSDADTVALLGRWRRWHWLRVGLGLLAFVAAVVAVVAGG